MTSPSSPGSIKPSSVTVKGLVGFFYTVAFITTLLRLLHRHQRRHLGWDDLWAGMALSSAIVTFLLFVLRPIIFGRFAKPLPSVHVPIPVQSFLVLGAVVFYMAGLWCSKISVAATIVRLIGDGSLRRLAKWAVALFVLVGFALSMQRIFRCGTNFSQPAFCTTPRYTGYVELIFDMAGDTWLIGAPLYLLKRMRLDRQDQRVIAAVFLCGLFVTIASILHDAFILADEITMVGLTAHIQLAVSIIISNLPVLVTYVYRKMQRDSEVDSSTERTGDIALDPGSNEHERATPMSVLTPTGDNSNRSTGLLQAGRSIRRMEMAASLSNVGSRSTHSTLDLGSMLNSVRSNTNSSDRDSGCLSSRSGSEGQPGITSVPTSIPTK